MQRVQLAIDHHHAVLAHFAIRPAGIEVAEDGQILAGEFSQCRGQLRDGLDSKEMTPGVEAGCPDQKRKLEAVAGERCGGVRSGQQRAR